jgi:hypothetical protein
METRYTQASSCGVYIIAGIIALIVLYMLTTSPSRKNRFQIDWSQPRYDAKTGHYCCQSQCHSDSPDPAKLQKEIPMPKKTKNIKYINPDGSFNKTLYDADVNEIKTKNNEIRKHNAFLKADYQKCVNDNSRIGGCRVCLKSVPKNW